MHDGCFGLIRRPFASVPQVDDYFAGDGIESARTVLTRCIQRGEGAGLVIGPSGTGKTLLCLMLAKQFQRDFRVAMLPSGRLSTRRALFQAIRYELGRSYRGMDEGELRLAVVDDLTADETSPPLVLLVDEAHVLPLRLLEELRLLTNLVRNGQPLVRLVLAGGSILEERFASPKLDSFNQRLAARCYLNAFNRTETQQYIHHHVRAVGGQAELLFPPEACQKVFQATGGSPRLINQVCDHAMLLACVAARQQITAVDVEEAWADLQQLPAPWTDEAKPAAASGVIEFGSLDDAEETGLQGAASFGEETAATLRISPDLEETEEFGAPTQQIRRIEELLAEADNDFQPAGSIGPEIELHFEESPHPFQEEFEHEEIISDRYAASRRFAAKPAVAPSMPSASYELNAEAVKVEEKAAAAIPTAPVAHDVLPAAITAAPEKQVAKAHGKVVEIEEIEEVVPRVAPAASLPKEATPGTGTTETPAGEEYVRPVTPRPEPLRAHEFRRLFARLRRG